MMPEKRTLKVIATSMLLMLSVSFAAFLIGEQTEQQITGRATAQAYIYETPPANCTKTLYSGINIVSFFCEGGKTPINESLVDKNNNSLDYNYIFTYTSGNSDDPWLSYNPSLPNWTVQQIKNLNRRQGYIIYMNSQGTYNKEGYKFQITNIDLKEGWNLIGYPSDVNKSLIEGLNTTEENITIIQTLNKTASDSYWIYYVPGVGGNLTVFESYLGYWVNSTSNMTWRVDW